MMDICSVHGCENLVDVDGYEPEVHGALYCDPHQPRCKTCGNFKFRGECWQCDKEAWRRAWAKVGRVVDAGPLRPIKTD